MEGIDSSCSRPIRGLVLGITENSNSKSVYFFQAADLFVSFYEVFQTNTNKYKLRTSIIVYASMADYNLSERVNNLKNR